MTNDPKAIFDDLPNKVKLAPEQDWELCREVRMPDGTMSKIKEHAKVGVRAIIANPYFGLFDEMGGMKSAQAIVAAQFLYIQGVINRVIVLAPASVRPVWFDSELGELVLQLFEGLPARVSEFHSRIRRWDWGDWSKYPDQLRWIVTNYEFLGRSRNFTKRRKKLIPAEYLVTLLKFCGPKTLLVLDESSAVKNRNSLQAKAAGFLRKVCGRVLLLNGTPIADSPMDLMNQGNIMSPTILGTTYVTHFRTRYCIMRPNVDFPQIVGWKNLSDLQERYAPYVLRRLKEHCLDLPPKLPPVIMPVALTESTWTKYKKMRDELVVWVTDNEASLATLPITRVIRLSQLTSGLLGGIEEVFPVDDVQEVPEFMQNEEWFLKAPPPPPKPTYPRAPTQEMQEVSTEKQDAVIKFIAEKLEEDPHFKILLWCRFRAEVFRLAAALEGRFGRMDVATMTSGQGRSERALALRLLNPRTANPQRPAALVNTYGTGSMGHNFTAAATAINVSYDYSLFKFKQGSDRIHRPGQTKPVSYFDVVATGPKGQKTIDHTILKARREKDDIATWTANAWVTVLRGE